MKIELQCGDKVEIPEGCIAQIDDNKITIKEKIKDFKDGDVIISDFLGPYELKIIMIYNGTRSNDGGYNCYVFRNHNGKIKINDNACNYSYTVRLATEKEKQELFDYMRDVGLQWNAEEKQVEKLRWKAKNGEYYYHINGDGFASVMKDTDYISDRYRYNFGNYFRTKEQTEEAAKRVQETLLNYHKELNCGQIQTCRY